MLSKIRQSLDDRANQHVGLLAEFSDPGALVHAVEGLREKGYSELDTFTPFPIHGMDRAMGLGVSKLGFMVFGGAILGGLLGAFLQWYTSASPRLGFLWTELQSYAINISNKPLFAWESSVPVIFELTILFSALTAVGGMLALNGLPKPYNPLFNSERFGRATDDAFFVHVSGRDGTFSRETTASDLFDLGAMAVEFVDHEGVTQVTGPEAAPAALPAPAVPQHTTGDI
ncbi:hypothetical protein B1759_07685 [Rubrivirga sp. SAORIC476]|uniref:DUF3341 domain-containing protein n=1 Tax=Rubrivirga sp. SAORIC476 TaxID=1961794 RepID=UPI000BA9A7BF|nr:DUF3341 domain-containing protein [Rubrivirga sp. SAORIC476]MAQ93211.1 DUF3341 domain-containing protein [Rhodothermaceae bacterium]MBC14492.1 DUF3341 domain-containing protein [Rhodothermaceae bacterium]PAP81209.1 hypothetical protein B1759_07685 [Rubrivirga sp. SAORIC476]